jgi:RimJ/RimL family protein N-acetyltransferase
MEEAILVRQRPPAPGDVAARAALGTSAEILRMYGYLGEGSAEMTREEAADWWKRLRSHPCAWVIEADGEVAGEVRLDGIDATDRRARLAIGLFSERFLGRGIGRQAIRQVLEHAFGSLGLHRIDLRVLSYNQRAIRCYQACGFVCEGIERESAWVGGAWHDDWIMSILEHEFDARRKGGARGGSGG